MSIISVCIVIVCAYEDDTTCIILTMMLHWCIIVLLGNQRAVSHLLTASIHHPYICIHLIEEQNKTIKRLTGDLQDATLSSRQQHHHKELLTNDMITDERVRQSTRLQLQAHMDLDRMVFR